MLLANSILLLWKTIFRALKLVSYQHFYSSTSEYEDELVLGTEQRLVIDTVHQKVTDSLCLTDQCLLHR